MKKALSCILVLAMFLSLGLFGGWSGRALADTPEDRVGTYVLTELIMDEEDYTSMLSAAGIVFTLALYEDGTGMLTQGEDELPLTWDENNIYDENNIAVPYTFEDGVLVMTEEGMIMTFQKTDSEELPDKTGAVDQSPLGTWVGTYDLKEYISELEPEMGALMENALASVTVELREDGTYTLFFDAAPMIPSLKAALYAYVEQLCEESGLTIEAFEEAYGSPVDDLIEEALKEFDLSEINQNVEGEYEMVDGEVVFDGGATRGIFTGDALIIGLEEYGEVVLKRAGIYGLWAAEMDFAAVMGEADESLAEALKDVTAQVLLEIRSDNTFIVSMDPTSMMPALRVAMTAYLEAMLAEQGMTIEQFESMTGQTLDAVLDEAFKGMTQETLEIKGTYEQEDGQITMRSEDGTDTVGTLSGNTLTFTADSLGELSFTQLVNEDVLAKGEGVMTYAEYAAAELDSPVVIEAYVLDHQSWWNDQVTLYAEDAEGGYFMYNMACSEEDAELLVPGQKIRVTGFKAEWAGEVEIIDATFEFLNGSYPFRPIDITEAWGSVDMIEYQNRFVRFRGAVVEPYDETGAAFAYKDPDGKTDDLYFKVTIGDTTYEFCVEYYLRGNDTEVYQAVENLQVGDVIDLEGFLYWYEGPNLHTTGVTVR